jgi:hypothetical protein
MNAQEFNRWLSYKVSMYVQWTWFSVNTRHEERKVYMILKAEKYFNTQFEARGREFINSFKRQFLILSGTGHFDE